MLGKSFTDWMHHSRIWYVYWILFWSPKALCLPAHCDTFSTGSNIIVRFTPLVCALYDSCSCEWESSYTAEYRVTEEHEHWMNAARPPPPHFLKNFCSLKWERSGRVSSSPRLPGAIHGTKFSGRKGPLPSTPTVLRKASSYSYYFLCGLKLLNFFLCVGQRRRLVLGLAGKDWEEVGRTAAHLKSGHSYIPSKGQSWENGEAMQGDGQQPNIWGRVPNKHSAGRSLRESQGSTDTSNSLCIRTNPSSAPKPTIPTPLPTHWFKQEIWTSS